MRNDDDLKDLEGQGEVLYGIIANFLSIFPSTLQEEYDSEDDDDDDDDDDYDEEDDEDLKSKLLITKWVMMPHCSNEICKLNDYHTKPT